jgi:hypothetical protein
MFTAASIASWLTIFRPLLEAFFNAFGQSLNDFLSQKRADQNAKDLGAAQAQNEQAQVTITAQQSELQAQADAPANVSDAIKRLEEGSA